MLLVLLLLALVPASAGATASPPVGGESARVAATASLDAATGVFWSHPIRVSPLVGSPPGSTPGAAPALPAPAASWNYSMCGASQLPVGQVTTYDTALNFSIAVTPANLTSVGPMNFTWNTTVYGPGLPPFHTGVWIDSMLGIWSPSSAANRTNFSAIQDSGSLRLNATGTYGVLFEVFDSSCESEGALVQLTLEVTNATLGASPISVRTTTSGSTAPENVTYQVSGVPAGYALIVYNGPNLNFSGNATSATWEYYLPGTYNDTICLVQPNGFVYVCVVTPNVLVGGPAPFTLAIHVGAGSTFYPVEIWGNVTNTTLIPANSSLYLYSYNGSAGQTAMWTGSTITENETVGCGAAGYPTELRPGPAGTCEFYASFVVWNVGLGITYGYLEQTFNVTAVGNATQWFLTTTFTHGPINFTSAPAAFVVNATVSGGGSNNSYTAWSTLYGDNSYLPNATLLPAQCPKVSGWNGSLRTTTFPLNHTGVYWGMVLVTDLYQHFAYYFFPIIYVGLSAPSHYALSIWANETGAQPLSTNATPLAVTFDVNTSGGAGPYTVQWAFGDGTFGTSASDAVVTHVYRTAGTYTPVVQVTDSQGDSVNQTLPAVVVTNPTSTSPTGNQTPPGAHPTGPPGDRNNSTVPIHARTPPTVTSAPPTTPGLPWGQIVPAGAVAVVFLGLALLWRRRQLRAEGEALLGPMDPVTSSPSRPGR